MKYKIGDVIYHKIFGKGKVIEVKERPNSIYGVPCINDPDLVYVEFDKPMLTEAEKDFYWLKKPIKVREFTEYSLPSVALMDEF